jgi:iron complex transport system ATP-binding protein
VIGPNGAGKTTLLQVISAQIHPSSGVAGLLGEVLGTVDVFELRPASASLSRAGRAHPARGAGSRCRGLGLVRGGRPLA